MTDFATSFQTALSRSLNGIIDDVAKLGLVALNKSLEGAGLRKMEGLKDYQVFSHAAGDTIVFEIVLDVEGLEQPPEEQAADVAESAEILESEVDRLVFRTYGLTSGGGVARLRGMHDARRSPHDARRPARDARRPARDARRSAAGRAVAHGVARKAPRSIAGMRGMRVTKEGKLSLSFQKTMSRGPDGEMQHPTGQFSGIMKDFMDRVKKIVAEQFVPELALALERHVL